MDKLTPLIGWIKKNNFWLGCGILLLSMLGMWFYQTTTLDAEQEKNVSDINKKFTTAQNIKSKKPEDLVDSDVLLHPNQSTQEGMTKELEKTVESIVAAWKLRVDAQKELLVFPDVIGQQKFKDVFSKYNPPETFPAKYADFQIDALLSLYRVKVKDHMINIAGKNGVRTNWRWDPENYKQDDRVSGGLDGLGDGGLDGGFGGGFGGDGGLGLDGGVGGGLGETVVNEDASKYAVLWSDTNQKLWQDKLTKFQDRDDHGKESNDPTPLQCYMLQQDLWLLEAMFNIIRDLNADSVSTDTSAIKQIDHLAFGREGNSKLGNLHPVDARLGPSESGDEEAAPGGMGMEGGMGGGGIGGLGGGGDGAYEKHFSEDEKPADDGLGMDGEMGFDDGGGMGLGDGGGPGGAQTAQKQPPFHELYVDTKFEPISADEVLAVVQGNEIPENHLELLIAKRVPVRVGLKMDERKIAEFMAACANSPFAFEIQQVRINRHIEGGEPIELAGKGGGAGGFSGMEGGLGMDGGFGGMDAGMGGMGGGTSVTGDFDKVKPVETRTNFDVRVEFFGIVKIYNPVREDLLRKAVGLPTESDEPTPEATDEPVEAALRESQPGNRSNS
jgi:hypothetical protein